MINAKHLRAAVVRPTLEHLGLWSQAAEDLLIGTVAQESNGKHLFQLGGPALGLWQMEPATARDIWDNFLRYRPDLAEKVRALMIPGIEDTAELAANLPYACAMARILYLRAPEALPAAGDVAGMARYWKRYYNTKLGKGTEHEFTSNWARLVA